MTGDLSPLVKVSFFTSLLKTAEVTPQARLTAIIATCLSVAKSNDILDNVTTSFPVQIVAGASCCCTVENRFAYHTGGETVIILAFHFSTQKSESKGRGFDSPPVYHFFPSSVRGTARVL